MASQINNDTLYITNADTLNEIYSLVRTALTESKGTEDVKLSTKAGDFFVKKEEAQDALRRLEEMDRSDDVQKKKDGKISSITFYKNFNEYNGKNLVEHGFKINFAQFTPNQLWISNYSPLEQYAANNKLFTTPGQKLDEVQAQKHLWRYVTTATLSGITPALFKQAEELCNLSFGCNLFINLHANNGFTSASGIDGSGSITQQVFWNLSFDTDNSTKLLGWFVHERGHGIYQKAAHDKGYQNFGSLLRSWLSGQTKYQRAAELYFNLDKTDRRKNYYINYILEEMADATLKKEINPSLTQDEKQRWLHDTSRYSSLPQEDFNHSISTQYGETPNDIIALYLAMIVHTGETIGIEKSKTDSLKHQMETFLKGKDKNALAVFHATLKLGKGVAEYASSAEFKVFIGQNIPPSFKNKKGTIK